IHVELALGLDWKGPAQRNSNYQAFIEAALTKLRGGNIRFRRESADLHACRKAARYFNGQATIARQILSGPQGKIQFIPGHRIIKRHVPRKRSIRPEIK